MQSEALWLPAGWAIVFPIPLHYDFLSGSSSAHRTPSQRPLSYVVSGSHILRCVPLVTVSFLECYGKFEVVLLRVFASLLFPSY